MSLALWAAAGTGVQVGATIVATRWVVADVPPLTLALLRYAIGFVCLLPFATMDFMKYRRSPLCHIELSATHSRASDFVVMLGLGVGQFAVLISLMNVGLQHIPAARAALVFSLLPLLTLALSAAVGRERVSPPLAAGVVLSIVGVALAPGPAAWAHGKVGSWWGHLAVLGSALVGAVCSVAYRPYLRRYPTLPVSALAMGASVAVLAVAALTEGWPDVVGRLGHTTWLVVGFIGLSSGVAYVGWLYALKHESPTRVTVFLALNPVTAAALGWWWLNEPVDQWTWAAVACVGTAIWLANQRRT